MNTPIHCSKSRPGHSRSFACALGGVGLGFAVFASACAHGPPPVGMGGDSAQVTAPSTEPADAGDGVEEAFCNGPGRGWFDVGQALDAGCYPPEPCGDGGFRVPAAVLEVYAWDGDHLADELREDNVEFRLTAEGNWLQHSTTRQEMACTARLCGPGRIVIESRYCFSETAPRGVDFSMQSSSVSAGCRPGKLPPGHYTATVDGLSVQFDVPQATEPAEELRQAAWYRFDTHPCPGDPDPNAHPADDAADARE